MKQDFLFKIKIKNIPCLKVVFHLCSLLKKRYQFNCRSVMSRYTGPKNRIARKFGVNIFGRLRNPLIHKTNPPGMHGARRRKKSDYGLQLEEKQKLKAVYGMLSDKQLIRIFKKAARSGNTVNSLVAALESRLDNVVYRMRIAPTIFAAQQLVSHGHILVNGKKVDVRSFKVTPGMKISVKEKSMNMGLIKHSLENTAKSIPDYLTYDPKTNVGQFVAYPEVDQVSYPLPINFSVICDFLAHTT